MRLIENAHPDRVPLSEELHARPPEPMPLGRAISRLTMLSPENNVDADRAHIAALCATLKLRPPGRDARWHVVDIGAAVLRWERHTEMSTLTIVAPIAWDQPFADTALSRAPSEWLEATPGRLLAGVHLELRQRGADDAAQRAEAFGGEDYACGLVADAEAVIASDFRLKPDGFSRILVHAAHDTPPRNGRVVQAALEIDTYRMAALLAFPLAQAARATLSSIEADLAAAMQQLSVTGDSGDDRALLASITRLAARAEKLIAETSYRFAAATAYHRLVQERLDALDEESGAPGLPSWARFLARRLSPAMRTCDAAAQRERALVERIDRATRLLATRVQVTAEEQNSASLASMNRRAKLQLALQETVEGLSVFAISYYALGLVGAGFKALEAAHAPIEATIATGLSAPVVIAVVWVVLRRMRRRIRAI